MAKYENKTWWLKSMWANVFLDLLGTFFVTDFIEFYLNIYIVKLLKIKSESEFNMILFERLTKATHVYSLLLRCTANNNKTNNIVKKQNGNLSYDVKELKKFYLRMCFVLIPT